MKRVLSLLMALGAFVAAPGLVAVTAPAASAAVSIRVESQITAHDLPYLASPYVAGSALQAGDIAPVECQTQGREPIGGSMIWYRVNALYYPSYAFAGSPDKVPCGVSQSVPLAANGWSTPSFSSAPADGLFTSGDSIKILCTASGQAHEGSNAWFFTRGYWLHSSRISQHPNGNGYSTCRGFTHPNKVTATIAAAQSMINRYPYSWGGGGKSGPSYGVCCSPSGRDGTNVYGFDCSGLTQYAFYKGAGVDIGANSRDQYTNGYKVALAQIQAGDLVFWSNSSHSPAAIHHVALYVGSGQIVEATPDPDRPDVHQRSFSTGESGVMPYVVRPLR